MVATPMDNHHPYPYEQPTDAVHTDAVHTPQGDAENAGGFEVPAADEGQAYVTPLMQDVFAVQIAEFLSIEMVPRAKAIEHVSIKHIAFCADCNFA